uniref:PiggyBac transposable element-derived protein 4 n=1 Tax=Schizaphis graminum TaxID=13262 RepID=A0A2S2P793_SCHGA
MINSNNCMIPSEIMCIDESVIPFTGRLLFKQYIKNKRHKYGIKLFKLCIPPNYTISIKVYSGKEATVDGSVATNLVMELTDPFLNFGRTMVVDNWYTSIELAEILGQHNTYILLEH